MNKNILSQDSADKITSAFKMLHAAALDYRVANKLSTEDIPSDFSKCTPDHFGKVSRVVRDALTEKAEADKLARLLPFKAAIAKASEAHITTAQRAWSQVAALPAETRETLGLKAPSTVKVPVSDFASAWKSPTDMARDLNEMGVKVVEPGKPNAYIIVNIPQPATSAPAAKAA